MVDDIFANAEVVETKKERKELRKEKHESKEESKPIDSFCIVKNKVLFVRDNSIFVKTNDGTTEIYSGKNVKNIDKENKNIHFVDGNKLFVVNLGNGSVEFISEL